MNKIIQEHLDIYKEYHEPLGITLAEDKEAWLELLDEDPEMQLSLNWADGVARDVRALFGEVAGCE